MKTATGFFPIMITMLIVGLAGSVNGQGRGHHKGNEKHHGGNHERRAHGDDHHNRDHHWKHERHGHGERHARHYRHDRYVAHHHDRHCSHARFVRYYERPRYIYYRDYDVYYDIHQSVYITWSGRNWAASASLPVVLQRVDRHNAVRMEVDYHHDDFSAYLSAGKPAYRRLYTGS